jgi:hypothetical protein
MAESLVVAADRISAEIEKLLNDQTVARVSKRSPKKPRSTSLAA